MDAGNDITICEGENVTLNASGASSYTWDNGVNDGQPFNPTITTTYSVIGTDANGCTGTDNVTITVNSIPSVSLSTDDTVCVNHDNSALNGLPAGGTYSGVGVTGNEFSPGTAGVGTFQITYNYTDGNGCSNTANFEITVDGCASIDDVETKNISVFPNPTLDQLTVVVEGEFSGTIVDAKGRKVANIQGVNNTTVDVSSFEMGVYFVNVKAGTTNKTSRIIKQ